MSLEGHFSKELGPFGRVEYGFTKDKGVYMKVSDSNIAVKLVQSSMDVDEFHPPTEVDEAVKAFACKEEGGTHENGVYAMFRTGGDNVASDNYHTSGDWEVVCPDVMLTMLERYGATEEELKWLGDIMSGSDTDSNGE